MPSDGNSSPGPGELKTNVGDLLESSILYKGEIFHWIG
jgi:hypothetical protein